MGVIFLNNNGSNINMAELLSMLSKMNKKDLETGIAKANEILKSSNSKDIIDKLKNNK